MRTYNFLTKFQTLIFSAIVADILVGLEEPGYQQQWYSPCSGYPSVSTNSVKSYRIHIPNFCIKVSFCAAKSLDQWFLSTDDVLRISKGLYIYAACNSHIVETHSDIIKLEECDSLDTNSLWPSDVIW